LRHDDSPIARLVVNAEHRVPHPFSTKKGTNMSDTPQPVTPQSGLTDNAAGAISYLTFIPAIIFLAIPPYNSSPFVRFHAWQSIFLNIAAFVVWIAIVFMRIAVGFLPWGFYGLVSIVSMVSLLIDLLWFILWLVCVLKAANGGKFVIPVIGNLAEQQAKK
jgi:uncharacterized membrane protein